MLFSKAAQLSFMIIYIQMKPHSWGNWTSALFTKWLEEQLNRIPHAMQPCYSKTAVIES